ncbi:unnamed protein product, partial [Mesorhabditis spiculigera]
MTHPTSTSSAPGSSSSTGSTISPTTSIPLTPCKALFVADLSDAGNNNMPSQPTVIKASVQKLFEKATNNQLDMSIAFWRYSSGMGADGPMPTTFVKDNASVNPNFDNPGGDLNIVNATVSLNAWTIGDAFIVLFTGSTQNEVTLAGQTYSKRAMTIGVSSPDEYLDISPIAVFSLPLDSASIVQMVTGLCQKHPSVSSTPGLTTGSTPSMKSSSSAGPTPGSSEAPASSSPLPTTSSIPTMTSTATESHTSTNAQTSFQTSSPQSSSTSPVPSSIGPSTGKAATRSSGSTVTVVSSTIPASTVFPNGSSTSFGTSGASTSTPQEPSTASQATISDSTVTTGSTTPQSPESSMASQATGSYSTVASGSSTSPHILYFFVFDVRIKFGHFGVYTSPDEFGEYKYRTYRIDNFISLRIFNPYTEPGLSSSTTAWTSTPGSGNSTSSGTSQASTAATYPSTGSTAWTTTAELSTARSSGPQRIKCTALFYIDASNAATALNATSPEKDFILNIGEILYADGSIELHAALAAYGDDDFDQKPDVDTTDGDLLKLTADLDHAIAYLNKISEKLANVVVVLFTASNQDIIDSATGSNSHASWTIGLALSGQNLTGIAVEMELLQLQRQELARPSPFLMWLTNTNSVFSYKREAPRRSTQWSPKTGRGDEESDGPLPTTFAYDLQSVVINFGLQGGNLDIEYATKKLSSWQVEDAIIVLFTGSDPSKFAPAGRDYTRKVWTVGVAAGVDTSPFAARSIIYMQPLAIFDAVVDLCQSGTTTTSFPETTATAEISTSTSTSPPERTKCVALFYIDASTATIALNATSPEKAFILSIGEALYPDGSIELIAALAAYGDDDFDQKPDVDTTDVDLVNLTADLDQYRFEAPNDDNVKNAIRYLNQIEAKLNNIVVVLMTASNQDIIDSASGSNQHASWTIGLALSGQNLTGIAVESADLTMKDQTASLLKTIATSALSKWVIQDAVIVLFTGSDPSKFAAAGEHYNRRWSTVGVTVGADASPFAVLSIPYMQPLAIFQSVIELCQQKDQSTTTSAPTTEFDTSTVTQSSSILTTATSTPPTATSTNQLTSSEPDPASTPANSSSTKSPGTSFPLKQCKVLFVADLSDAGIANLPMQKPVIVASMQRLLQTAATNQLDMSIAYWRYSSGPDIDGLIPNTFAKDLFDVGYNFDNIGGDLNIVNATNSLNAWPVDDAFIVLFTGSSQKQVDLAGTTYLKRNMTIGVSFADVDTSPFASVSLLMDSTILVETVMQFCQSS